MKRKDTRTPADLMADAAIVKAPTEKTKELSLPYPWCMDPDKCNGKSHCPRDPNCGD